MIKERLISALIGTLLLLVFQPFGLGQFGKTQWILMLGLAVCCLSSCLVSEYITRYVFRMSCSMEKGIKYLIRRNFYFQIVNTILMTTIISLYLDKFACNEIIDNHLSLTNTLIVFAMIVGASVVIGLYWRNVYWKRHYMHELADAQRLNGILEERSRIASSRFSLQEEDTTEETVLLEGTTKENLRLCFSDFLYAISEGNYVSVFYLHNNELQKSVLRTSIKNVALVLCKARSIVHCHRAFVVNTSFVETVEGRSSGIGLKLKFVKDIIPVSKAFVVEVKQLIQYPQ